MSRREGRYQKPETPEARNVLKKKEKIDEALKVDAVSTFCLLL